MTDVMHGVHAVSFGGTSSSYS